MFPITPEEDGVTHINVYTKGKTGLGRGLSNLSSVSFTIPGVGSFRSMEAYWYWVKTGKQFGHLMKMSGFEAKQEGKQLPTIKSPTFEDDILDGHLWRLKCSPMLTHCLSTCRLPLVHYYNYGSKVIVPQSGDFQMDYLNYIRRRLNVNPTYLN